MTTLLNLSQSISDMQQELAREQRFSRDAYQSLKRGVGLVREALDALEKELQDMFVERDRAMTRLHGNSAPFTTTIEADENRKVIENKKRKQPAPPPEPETPIVQQDAPEPEQQAAE